LDPDASKVCTIILSWGLLPQELTDGHIRFS